MDAPVDPNRQALMFVRFVAIALVGMSAIELSSYWAEYHFRQKPVNLPFAALWGLIFLAGIGLIIKSRAVAGWLADKLE